MTNSPTPQACQARPSWPALLGVTLFLVASAAHAAEWHVTPQGTPKGQGTKDAPWDLATALAHPTAVKPGDTVWLHAGTYAGHFHGRLKGTAAAPIVVRQAPGERAVLDGNFNRRTARMGSNVLEVGGAHTWYWGFEIASSHPKRTYDKTCYGEVEKPWGLDSGNNEPVPGTKLINLVIHDTAQGPGVWRGATDHEMYGCIIFNNGYVAPDRGHGHGTYTQNETGTRRIVDNVIFNQYGYGIHAYGSEKAFLNGFHIEGNILFGNGGVPTTSGYSANILVGGGRVAERPVITNNCSYFPTAQKGGTACRLGYGKGITDAVVKDNYLVGGRTLALKGTAAEVAGNVMIGEAEGLDAKAFPDNTQLAKPPAEGIKVFVRPNRYEPGRAHVCVFNWAGAAETAIDLAGVLKAGDGYEVRDVQNVLGPTVAKGTYDGKAVRLPLALATVAQPVGDEVRKIEHTPREFNAFLITTVAKPR